MNSIKKAVAHKIWSGSFYFLFSLGLLYVSSGFKNQETLNSYSLSGLAQGTTYKISYYATKQTVSENQIDSILCKIDSSMSIYKSYSLISAFNISDASVTMDNHFKTVIEKSFEISRASDGIFDITIYPLVEAWGFGPVKPDALPDRNQIKAILKDVGYQHLKIEGDQLIKDKPFVKIDLNGIAQGYSVDVVADFLTVKGVKSFIVELGGELRVKGTKPGNERYKIGIEGVNDGDFLPVQRYIEIENGAITTSGNYRKFHQAGSRKISHLINPKTGFYLQNNMISATVYAKDAISADGYDNVLMGLGLEQALTFLKKRKDLSAYLVYTENGVVKDTCTTGFPEIKKF